MLPRPPLWRIVTKSMPRRDVGTGLWILWISGGTWGGVWGKPGEREADVPFPGMYRKTGDCASAQAGFLLSADTTWGSDEDGISSLRPPPPPVKVFREMGFRGEEGDFRQKEPHPPAGKATERGGRKPNVDPYRLPPKVLRGDGDSKGEEGRFYKSAPLPLGRRQAEQNDSSYFLGQPIRSRKASRVSRPGLALPFSSRRMASSCSRVGAGVGMPVSTG